MQHKLIIKFIFVLFSILIAAHSNAQTHTLVQGWNLEGNDNGATVDPNAIFGNATTPTTVSPNVTTVWTWDKIAGIWNFFAPSMTPSALSAYAATKGYGVLTTISQGQGFWINANSAVSVNLTAPTTPPSSYSLTGVTSNGVTLGGNLIAPVTVGSNVYYYWDISGDGTSAGVDYVLHDLLDQIINGGILGDNTKDTTDSSGNSACLSNGLIILLPTQAELLALYTAKGIPTGWDSNLMTYPYFAAATQVSPGVHDGVNLVSGLVSSGSDNVALSRVAFKINFRLAC